MYHAVIDEDFLKNHYNNKPKADDFTLSKEMQVWASINEFIFYDETEITIITKTPLDHSEIENYNPILKKILIQSKRLSGSGKNVSVTKEFKVDSIEGKKDVLSNFYFIDTFPIGFSPSDVGCLLFRSNNILSKWPLNPERVEQYHVTGDDLTKNGLKKWEDFKVLSQATDCLVIADNYIFKDKRNIKQNFIPFLKSLLPNDIKKTVQVTVFTRDLYSISDAKEEKDKCYVELSDLHKEIEALIKEKLPHIVVNLTIIKKHYEVEGKTTDLYHDRSVFSRYLRIELTNSISFFNGQGIKIGGSDVSLRPEPLIKKNGQFTIGHSAVKQLKKLRYIIDAKLCTIVNDSNNFLLEFDDTKNSIKDLINNMSSR